MRLEAVFNSAYTLSSLWGGSPVCPARPAARPEAGAPITAFVDVNVVPMDTERVLPNQTVVVEGGKITALGPASQVRVPASAVRIDGRGKYLMPGLNDAHVHAMSLDRTFDQIRTYMTFALADGVTAIRYLVPVSTGTVRAWQEFWKTSDVPFPRLYLAPPISLQGTPDEAMAVVANARSAGYDHISADEWWEVASPRHRVVFDSVVAASRRAGFPISAHAHNLRFEPIFELGKTGGGIDHLYPLMAGLGVKTILSSYNEVEQVRKPEDVPLAELRALAAKLKRAGVWVAPTLHCSADGGSRPSHASANSVFLLKLTKTLHDEGVGLLLAGDEPEDVRSDLTEMVNAGLTPYEALRTGTYNMAQYMRLLDSTGTVAVGKRADLVLLYGNPLVDIRHTREAAGVMVAGRWLDRIALDQRLMPSPNTLPLQLWEAAAVVRELKATVSAYRQTVRALADSLSAAAPSERERMLRQMAEVFGDIRLFLSPQQRDRFDPRVRVWLRVQARQGYRLAVAGVSPVPLSGTSQ